MPTILTQYANANPPASAPIIVVSPEEIAVSRIVGLAAWWKADVMYKPDSSGGSWRDRVNDTPLTLRRASWPVLTQGGQNGKAYLQFSQTAGTVLQTPVDAALWPLSPNPYTFAWIGQPSPNNYGVNETVFGNEQAGSGQKPSAVFYVGNDVNKPIFFREGDVTSASTNAGFPPSGGPHLMVINREPSAIAVADRVKVFADNVAVPYTGTGVGANTNSRLLVGGNMSADNSVVSNAGFGGRIYDLFVFRSPLSISDRAILAAYLQSQYALPV